MATQVLTNASIVINSVDLSDHANEVTVTDEAAMLPDTAFGASYDTVHPGLKKASIGVKFFQDRATGKVDATLSALVGAATVYSVVVIAVNTTVSATNPKWTLTNAQLSGSYVGVGGAVGAMEMTAATFVPGSGGTLTRATS